MNARDYDYIEARLLAPAEGANEAAERLLALGEYEKARKLTQALKRFLDECRAIRQELGVRP